MSESLGTDRIEHTAGPCCFTETWHAPSLVLPPHEHEHACVHFVLEGCYQETVGQLGLSLAPDSVLYKPAGVRHSNRFKEGGALTLRAELGPELVQAAGALAREPRHAAHPALGIVARRMRVEMALADDLTPLALEGLVRELLALLFRGSDDGGKRACLAEDCAALLRERFRQSIRLGALAAELGCERTSLSRSFRSRFGTTMGEYVRGLRVAEVMRRLEKGDAPLTEIALAAGFADQSHCTRVFHRLAGVTPATWQQRTEVPGRHTGSRRAARGGSC